MKKSGKAGKRSIPAHREAVQIPVSTEPERKREMMGNGGTMTGTTTGVICTERSRAGDAAGVKVAVKAEG